MDAAVKGKTELAEREGLSELLEGIDSSTIVLVERADRLARDLMVNELIVEQFRKLNVRVVECEGGSDITVLDNEPTKVLIRQVLAAIAQFEKSCIVAKLKAARDRMRKATGRCEGRKRYKTTDAVRDVILALHGSMPITAIARQLGLSRPTVYQVLRDAHPVS
jgi:DNA invertase Pin-like site-specific DNA recombinase